ncbi:hydrogenase-1 operon protein HyaE [Defluviimonas denitrificans]|jgi:hydrogenase-1 operon protein HyaE|uniref:Hydrogenase-1 operon protein HyaE n=1 Tax=Albidovulum denitrificans TaxID=404881 RepID=A0A2S8RYT9_9RHOB|nr:hydrogenase accessory protein [Defluviimonas denitrificans]PQV53730.1 hydrogenase-1 operon protein HyaE [Defluviimonas denitrificans]
MHDHAPHNLPPATGIHPLIARLESAFHYPRLGSAHDVTEFLARPGPHCLFIPGDPRRNLETADAAVILPELRLAFQNAFDCAVIDDAIEAALREEYRALKTPGLLFFRGPAYLGAIEKVRDWSDYLARTGHLLSLETA